MRSSAGSSYGESWASRYVDVVERRVSAQDLDTHFWLGGLYLDLWRC